MKFLQIGLGSMGKRRIRNLQHLGYDYIIGFDPRKDRLREAKTQYDISTIKRVGLPDFQCVDAVIISTPPDLHGFYAKQCVARGVPCFIEQDTFDWGLEEVIKLSEERGVLVAPSCTLRNYSLVKKMKKMLDNEELGKTWAFTCHAGEHLLNWHPWDGLDFYMSDKRMGGIFEMTNFDLVWLTWLFGYPTKVVGSLDKVSDIEADIYDLANLVMRFPDNVIGHLLSNVVSKVKERVCKIFCEKAVITWNWGKSLTVAYPNKFEKFFPTETITHGNYSSKIKEEPYIQEMEDFIKAVKGEITYPYTIEEVRQRLKITGDLEKKLRCDI